MDKLTHLFEKMGYDTVPGNPGGPRIDRWREQLSGIGGQAHPGRLVVTWAPRRSLTSTEEQGGNSFTQAERPDSGVCHTL